MRSSTGGRPLSPAGVSSLASVSTSVLSWPAARPASAAASLLALASAAADCTASSAASVSASILAISAISCWPSSAAALSLEASGARPTISRVCASSAVSWRSSLAICSRRSRLCVSRLCRRARASAVAVVELVQARFGALERGFGLVVGGERLLLEVGGEAGGVGERRGLGVEALDRLLGLGDQRLLARHVAGELLDAGLELALPIGRALRLALEVLLLDPEAGEDGALGGLLLAQRLQLPGGLRLGPDRLGLGLGGAPHLFQRGGELGLLGLDLALRLRPSAGGRRRRRACGSRPRSPCSAAPAGPAASGSRSASRAGPGCR